MGCGWFVRMMHVRRLIFLKIQHIRAALWLATKNSYRYSPACRLGVGTLIGGASKPHRNVLTSDVLVGVVYSRNVASVMPRRYSLFPFRIRAGGRRMQHLPLRVHLWVTPCIRAKGNKPRSVWLTLGQIYRVLNLPPPGESLPLMGGSVGAVRWGLSRERLPGAAPVWDLQAKYVPGCFSCRPPAAW